MLRERSASSFHSSLPASKPGIASQLGTAGVYVRAVIEVETRLRELSEVALRALPLMYDERTGLFSQKALPQGEGLANRGENAYYSAASMVGILAQKLASPDSVVPVGRALDALQAACDESRGAPLLGTTLWAGALAGDSRSARLVEALDRSLAIEAAESAALGQVLRGLVAGAEAFPEVRDRALDLGGRCAVELLDRHSASSRVFRAMPRRPSGLSTFLGSRISSFASQVYPLLGLASLYGLRGETPPPALRQTAELLVDAQGPLGQWWWLYSPGDATVLEGYPVYSVHQDGMAFMGLLPVEGLGEGSYREALGLGLEWLYERNELSISLVQDEPPFICRNIQRVGSDADAPFGISRANFYRAVARSWRSRSLADRTFAAPEDLEPLRECRSYHLGWCLLAHALASGDLT